MTTLSVRSFPRFHPNLVIGALLLQVSATAQTCEIACDANTVPVTFPSAPSSGRQGAGGTAISSFLSCHDGWYFTASTLAHGRELWYTDGTLSGTTQVKDIREGPDSSSPIALLCCTDSKGSETLFFRADDGVRGIELWKSDGTSAGTVLVKDIYPGERSSRPEDLTCKGDRVYFAATSPNEGKELWCSDGTAAGTVLVRDIQPGASDGSPRRMHLNSDGTEIYFYAEDDRHGPELWKTRGTSTTTVMVKDIEPGSTGSKPGGFVNHAGKTLFFATQRTGSGAAGTELWETDGTSTGTKLLKNTNSGAADGRPLYTGSIAIGRWLYFASTDVLGSELWRTDGTTAGTKLITDINPGPGSSTPSHFHRLNATEFVFRASTASHGGELWKSDGTTEGTVLVKDIRAGTRTSSPTGFANLGGGRVTFSAQHQTHGVETWVSDGTARGTSMLKDIYPGVGSGSGGSYTQLDSTRVLFAARDLVAGRELWITGGTPASTLMFKDIEPARGTKSGDVTGLVSHGRGIVYSAKIDKGQEPYYFENGRCVPLGDLAQGSASSAPQSFTTCFAGDQVLTFFSAWADQAGRELFVTDATPAGTRLVRDIVPGRSSSNPERLTYCNRRIFFRATTATSGTELWQSDGTAAGTKMVKDIRPGPGSSSPDELICCKGTLYFTATDDTNGRELWKSDGSTAGTVMIANLAAARDSSVPKNLTACVDANGRERIFFSADIPGESGGGRELWMSDGTTAGTQRVKDIYPGSKSSNPSYLTSCGNRIFFRALDDKSGGEPWVSDGTTAGTRRLADVNPGSSSSGWYGFTGCGDKVFFAASDGRLGTELYVSDGTSANTKLVKDLAPGPGSSIPREMCSAGNRLYFSATSSSHGRELYVSDGTAAGTRMVRDINPGGTSSNPGELLIHDCRLYFRATDRRYGTELWHVPIPGPTVQHVGQGCAPTYPTMTSSAPRLGTTAMISGTSGPSDHVGFVWVSGRVKPFRLPANVGGCTSFVGPPNVELLAIVTTPAWRVPFRIGNDRSLLNVCVAMQTWWVQPRDLVPLRTSNGIVFGIGR